MLPLLGDVTHGSSCTCQKCADDIPALWLIEAALLEINPTVQARKLMATQSGYSIDDDPFIRVELMLAATLATTFGAVSEEVERLLKDALRYEPLDRRRVDEALEQANILLGNVIDDNTLERIQRYVDELISDGARDAVKARENEDLPPVSEILLNPIPTTEEERNLNLIIAGLFTAGILLTKPLAKGTVLENVPSIQTVYTGMVASTKYYTNNHFNTVIMPELQKRIDELFSTTTTQPDPTDLIEYLGKRLKSVPYWRVVANAAASRAYHYGAMKAGELLGVRSYTIQAVLDERTSDICNYMDGKEFWLSDAVRLLEKAAVASIDDMKVLTPWLRYKDINGLNSAQLRDLGFMIPPFHGNCRSTIVFNY